MKHRSGCPNVIHPDGSMWRQIFLVLTRQIQTTYGDKKGPSLDPLWEVVPARIASLLALCGKVQEYLTFYGPCNRVIPDYFSLTLGRISQRRWGRVRPIWTAQHLHSISREEKLKISETGEREVEEAMRMLELGIRAGTSACNTDGAISVHAPEKSGACVPDTVSCKTITTHQDHTDTLGVPKGALPFENAPEEYGCIAPETHSKFPAPGRSHQTVPLLDVGQQPSTDFKGYDTTRPETSATVTRPVDHSTYYSESSYLSLSVVVLLIRGCFSRGRRAGMRVHASRIICIESGLIFRQDTDYQYLTWSDSSTYGWGGGKGHCDCIYVHSH